MENKKTTKNAVDILRRRYIKNDPRREASVQQERINSQIAAMIYELRNNAGLSQGELANLIGTTQSVISRLEDADYDGHSLSMLRKIADALNQKLTVVMTAKDPEPEPLRYAFHLCMQMLRRNQNLTIDELANKTGIDREELVAMERGCGYKPSPLILDRISEFYGISTRRLAALVGVIKEMPKDLSEHASRFAAKSESFAKLTDEEKVMLDEFIEVLKTEA